MGALHKRATVYFDPDLHRALRLKAAETDTSVSELVNEAVKETLAEDADDLAAFEERAHEPDLPFEDMVRDLKRRGKILTSHQAFGPEGDREDLPKKRTDSES
jgi:hypothetical protein